MKCLMSLYLSFPDLEGRKQKAREGKWNGGFAPYGYSLIDGKLVVNEGRGSGYQNDI